MRVDTRSGATSEIALAMQTPSAQLAAQGETLYVVDGNGGAWRVPAGETVAEKLAIGEHVQVVAASPRGDRAAFGGERGVWLVEQGKVERIRTPPRVHHVAFAPSGDELIAKAATWFTVWIPTRHVVDDPNVRLGQSTSGGAAVYAGATHFTVDPSQGLRRSFWSIAPQSLDIDHTTARPLFAIGDELAALVLRDSVWLLHDDRHTAIGVPDSSCRFSGAAGAYVLVAACRTGLFVWDLAPILPRRTRTMQFVSAAAARGADVLLLGSDGAVQQADVARRTVRAWPRASTQDRMLRWRAVSGDDTIAVHETTLLSRLSQAKPPLALGGEVRDAMIAGDRIILGTRRGVLESRGLDGTDPKPLHEHAASFARVSVAGTWIYGVWRDLHMVRFDLATGASTTATSGDSPTAISADGTVWWFEGRDLIRWPAAGVPGRVASTRLPITRLRLVHGTRVIAIVEDDTAHLIDASGSQWPLGRAGEDFSELRGEVVVGSVREGSGRMIGGRVIDTKAAVSWPIAATTSESLVATADGHWVVTTPRGNSGWLEAWPIDVPGSAAEMAAWIERLTNADYDAKAAALTWR